MAILLELALSLRRSAGRALLTIPRGSDFEDPGHGDHVFRTIRLFHHCSTRLGSNVPPRRSRLLVK
jgi:hypothetical protein